MMMFKNMLRFAKVDSLGLTARKYMRSISQSALNYRPSSIRQLNQKEANADRVVQQFFDSSSLVHRIKVFESENRLSQINQTSSPAHSYYQVMLPFQQNQSLRKKMIQFFDKYIRIGRVLQLMDYIAANVAYRYCSPSISNASTVQQLPFIVVTAAIDQIDFFHPIVADLNCLFSGYVSYVGTSSMQVQIAVMQQVQGKERLACSAKFLMAARDKKTGKAYKVPALDLSKQPESFKIRRQLGQKRQVTRKLQTSRALKISPPTYEQSTQVHNLLIKLESQKQKQKDWISMSKTVNRSVLLMHNQDRNLSGKIFGGFIIRLAYELGWLSAFKFLQGGLPRCTHIDDVQFLGPVQIGSVVNFQSVISYIDQGLLHVIVQCSNTNVIKGTTTLTNILRINFQHDKQHVRKVYPVTMRDTNQYIQSMRRVKKYLQK